MKNSFQLSKAFSNESGICYVIDNPSMIRTMREENVCGD